MMEKRVLIAAVISSLFLAWYAQSMRGSRPGGVPGPAVQAPASPPALKAAEDTAAAWPAVPSDEETVTLDSPSLQVVIGRSTAAIRRVLLKEFQDQDARRPLEFAAPIPLLQIASDRGNATWRLTESEADRAVFTSENGNILYRLDASNPLVEIRLEQNSSMVEFSPKLLMAWIRADKVSNRHNQLEIILLKKNNNGKATYEKRQPGQKNWTNVSRGTSILSLSERYFCLALKPQQASLGVRRFPASEGVAAVIAELEAEKRSTHELTAYFGPRDYFRMKRAGFGQAFPIGMLGQIGLILLTVLNWIAGIVRNYGVAVILFSGLVTSAMAPMTLISFRSMKKMQELKPKVDRLMSQHKDDPKRANQEVFALYREYRVSPMSGCLPMMLQIPIFMAMFNAISHFIELRGKSFLWIKDLSLPDHIAQLPISIPFLGSEVNLLPIIMAAAMYFQTKMSQTNTIPDKSNPSAAIFSSPMMPVMFGFMFYHFPAGLVLYWLTNSLVSMIFYRMAGMASHPIEKQVVTVK